MATQGSERQLQSGPSVTFNQDHYTEFFTHLTGKSPYPYQTDLAKKLVDGQSVILRAPTGSGKTWATVAPFIYSCISRKKFADRLLYALPLRSLASSLYTTTNKKLEELTEFRGRVCRSARNRRYQQDDPFYLGLQMGGQQDDPFFEGDITFTTIDQLLSSYLFTPVSLPERVANIGAGALIGSLLIFDEVHLLDPERSFATTIEMLIRLKGLAQFVLMTATMPDSVMDWLEGKLEAESMSLLPEEVVQLPSHAKKERSFEWRSSPLTAQDILAQHQNRTIAIANTVGRAQELYRELCEQCKNQPHPPEIFLLHSRFYQQDRKFWESKLGDYFGPGAPFGDAILISTQVVEAGIDISADVLLTELAPLNSLLQRAGRVARYPDRNFGRFIVFDLPIDLQGRMKVGPYRDRDSLQIVIATRELLISRSKLPTLDYINELDWLNLIHDVSDRAAIAHLDSLHTHAEHVLNAIEGLDNSARSRLIRETGSINVVVTDAPEELTFNSKNWPELLSVPRTSLFQLREACANAGAADWILKVPEEINSESNESLEFQWRVIKHSAMASWLVAIHPAYARYSTTVGLELGTPSVEKPAIHYKPSPPVQRYSYQKESFVIHARRVVDQGTRILSQCPRSLDRLKQFYEGFNLHEIFILACALHDTGKLQVEWQAEAEKWQQNIDKKLEIKHKFEPLAHTNFDPGRDRGEQWCKFPPHAACGGFALLPYFFEKFTDEVALLLCTAITRHHGAHTKELRRFKLRSDAAAILKECLPDAIPQPISVKLEPEECDLDCFSKEYLLHLNENENQYWWPLYISVLRVLRLADQGSFQN